MINLDWIHFFMLMKAENGPIKIVTLTSDLQWLKKKKEKEGIA